MLILMISSFLCLTILTVRFMVDYESKLEKFKIKNTKNKQNN